MNSLLEKPAAPQAIHSGFQFFHVRDIEIRPPKYIIFRLIEDDSFIIVYGESGDGKTFFIVNLALCIASGIPFFGRKIKRTGPVFIIAGEGRAGIIRRIAASCKEYGLDISNLPIFISNAPTALCDDDASIVLDAELKRCSEVVGPPAVVFIDTYSRNLGGDENSPNDGALAVRTMDLLRAKWGCTIVATHHVGHMDKNRARGWSGLRAAADTEFKVERASDGIIRVVNTKTKDGPTPEGMAFNLRDVPLGIFDEEGQEVCSAVLDSVDFEPTKTPKEPSGKNQKIALDILKEEIERCEFNLERAGIDPSTAGMSIGAWRLACAKNDMPKNRFYESRDALLHAGKIKMEGDHVSLC